MKATRFVRVVDTTPPVFMMIGDNPLYVNHNTDYKEPGVYARDAMNGNVSVSITGSVDKARLGAQTITYTARDNSSNIITLGMYCVSFLFPPSLYFARALSMYLLFYLIIFYYFFIFFISSR